MLPLSGQHSHKINTLTFYFWKHMKDFIYQTVIQNEYDHHRKLFAAAAEILAYPEIL